MPVPISSAEQLVCFGDSAARPLRPLLHRRNVLPAELALMQSYPSRGTRARASLGRSLVRAANVRPA